MWNHIDTTRQTGCSLPGTGIKILAESRADLQSAVWNRQFGICIENFLKQFSKGMIAKALENPAVYIPNRRFQTADCRSALLDSAGMLMPLQGGESAKPTICQHTYEYEASDLHRERQR